MTSPPLASGASNPGSGLPEHESYARPVTTPPRGTRAALYLRISSDREGQGLGVERQRQDCQERADREGWSIVVTYTDNDTGASTKSTKPRPEYGRMLDAARAGKFDIILSYSTSRLTRRLKEYEDLIKLWERHGVQVRTVVSGEDDLSTADGRMVARIKASVDSAEAERIGERVARKARENAEAGKFGGGRRPFGFEPDGVTIRDAEAEEIKKGTRAVLSGASLRSIARDMNSRGVTTTTGKPWTSLAVADLLRRPRNSGRIKYKPVERDDDDKRITNRSADAFGLASWEAIVTEDERLRVASILSDSRRKTSPGNQPRWLGSSIYRCGECGHKLVTEKSGSRDTRYVCKDGRGSDDRRHVGRHAAKTDALVVKVASECMAQVARFAREHGAGQAEAGEESAASKLTRKLSDNQQRQTDAGEEYADGVMDRAQYRSIMARLRERQAEINAELAEVTEHESNPLGDLITGTSVLASFEALDMDRKRTILERMFRVYVHPTTARGSAPFDESSIEVRQADPRNPHDPGVRIYPRHESS